MHLRRRLISDPRGLGSLPGQDVYRRPRLARHLAFGPHGGLTWAHRTPNPTRDSAVTCNAVDASVRLLTWEGQHDLSDQATWLRSRAPARTLGKADRQPLREQLQRGGKAFERDHRATGSARFRFGARVRAQWLEARAAQDDAHALAGATPIPALDMYEHSYHMDYGAKAAAYVDAFMQNINWPGVARLYEACASRA